MEEVAELSETSMYLYHMFNNSRYREKFLIDKNYRILDNGVFELNKLPLEEEYLKRIIDLSPEEIIAPDTPNNYLGTISKTNGFIRKYKIALGKTSVQAVVQAKNLDEAVSCYRNYSENPLIDAIGFPFRMNINIWGRRGGRKELIEFLLDSGLLNSNKPIHLLGLRYLEEVIEIAKLKIARSCDSSKFYRHAIKGISYEKGITNKNSNEPLNFEEGGNEKCLELLRENLRFLRQKIEG